MALTTTSLKLDAEVKARMQQLAATRRRSLNWLMGEAIREYVEREEKREQRRQDALAAWAEYQETGRHVSAEEADRWLARLEAGDTAPPPECHD
jgi:predicted transcriptional regulator